MLVHKEWFNIFQIAHASLRRVFQCGRVYLHFTYNDIYISYMQSPHLISISNVASSSSMAMAFNRHFAISAAVRFGRNSVAAVRFGRNSNPRLLL